MSRIDMRPSTVKGRYQNWLNRRAVERGRSPLPERLTRPVRSSLPVYKDRVNPATGRPHRDDKRLGRSQDRALARSKDSREMPDAYRGGSGSSRAASAEGNQRYVRDTLAERDPQYAGRLEDLAGRTVREMAPRDRSTQNTERSGR